MIAEEIGCFWTDFADAASAGETDGLHFDEKGYEALGKAVAALIRNSF